MTFIQFMTLFFFNLTICGSSGYDLGNDVSFSTSELCYEYFLTHDSMSLSDFYLIANRAMIINGVSYSSDELVYSDKLLEEWEKYCTANGITYTDPTPIPKPTKPDTNKGNSFTTVSSAGTFYFEDDEDDSPSPTATSTPAVTPTQIPKVSSEVPPATPATTEVILAVPEPEIPETSAPLTPWGKKPSSVKKIPVNKPAAIPDAEDEDFESAAVTPTEVPSAGISAPVIESSDEAAPSTIPVTTSEPAVVPSNTVEISTEPQISSEKTIYSVPFVQTESAPSEIVTPAPAEATVTTPSAPTTESSPAAITSEIPAEPSIPAESAVITPSAPSTEPSVDSMPAVEPVSESVSAPKADSQNYTSMGGFLFSEDDE